MINNKYDGLIFDMDGVIVDVNQSYRETIRQTASFFLKRTIKTQEVSNIKSKVGMNNDWDATYALINNTTISYKKVKDHFQSLYLGNSNKKGLISNEKLLISKSQFNKLKYMYKKIGIATGRPKEEAYYVITNNHLEKIFDCIIALEDVKQGKPSPDSIIKVINTLKLKNTVYIGDSPNDVIAAKASGITSIYIGQQQIGTMRFQSVLQAVKYLLKQ